MKKKSRLIHVMGCCKTAMKIAKKNSLNKKTVFIAALLHDCTKNCSKEKQLAIFDKYHFALDEETKQMPQLWHAISASLIAQNVLLLKEPVCSAIRWHTTGREGMNAEEAAVYVADMIEPTRAFPGVELLRSKTEENLLDGLSACLSQSISFIESRGRTVHTDTLKAYKWCKNITILEGSKADYDT